MIDVIFSSINVAGSKYGLKSPEWLGEFAQGAGCTGVEYMPLYDLLPGHTPKAIGRAVKSGELALRSLHSTFRETKHSSSEMTDTSKRRSPRSMVMSSALGRIVLPEASKSANVLGNIQNETGQKYPVTLYPQRSSERDRRQIKAANSGIHLFQPTDHVSRLIGAESLADFSNEMVDNRGYHFALDTFHARRRYGSEGPGLISQIETSVPVMAPRIRSVHLSLNRFDMKGEPHIPTLAEAKQAMQGQYSGELRHMLDIVKEMSAPEFVVLETTLGGVAMATGFSGIQDIQKGYADIADGFREYWGKA